jgi:serine/threonine-protein kinase HipA
MRKAKVYMYDQLAGVLLEDEQGYHYQYLKEYLALESAEAISLTLPLQEKDFFDRVLFPFFDGLIPDG